MTSIPIIAKGGLVPYCPVPIQRLLRLFNIINLPVVNDRLTSVARADALSNLDGLVHPDTKKLIFRLLRAMYSLFAQEREGERWDGEYLSIPWSYIRKAYHRDVETEIPVLIELGILESTGYSSHPANGRCRGFKVIWNKLTDVFSQPITTSTPKTFLALSGGKGQAVSDIARDADKSISTGWMSLTGVLHYFEKKISDDNGSLDSLMTEVSYVFNCYLNQKSYDKESGILTYKQTYHTTEIGGRVYGSSGDQYVSRELKKAWFHISDCFNYDIKGAHVALINQLYPTSFATKWITNNGFREDLARAIGVPLSLLKRSILALTYGGLPTAHHKCEIYQLFLVQYGDKSLAIQGLARFKDVTAEYRDALSAWFKDIRGNLSKYQTNAIGLTTSTKDAQSLASHYLQGLEQEAIRWISSQFNQTRYRYQVISNQFDGLVTVGMIPASVLSDFQAKFNLTIEIKDIG